MTATGGLVSFAGTAEFDAATNTWRTKLTTNEEAPDCSGASSLFTAAPLVIAGLADSGGACPADLDLMGAKGGRLRQTQLEDAILERSLGPV